LQVQVETINGIKEKRAVPVTKTRKIPFRDYEEKEVEIVVDVPMEEVKTRKGYRMDKHVVSKVVEVEEEHHYEMRPVFVGKGDVRMREANEHHAFKKEHGKPVWNEHDAEIGWTGRPLTPEYRRDLHRPASAGSILSVPTREAIYGAGALPHTRDYHRQPLSTATRPISRAGSQITMARTRG